ncbi:hypothetical protein F5B18DRAFT_603313 [Nemania serpens]|nr:hypothetical protein F5B18DRAFT_603313 [Nemania serpens]
MMCSASWSFRTLLFGGSSGSVVTRGRNHDISVRHTSTLFIIGREKANLIKYLNIGRRERRIGGPNHLCCHSRAGSITLFYRRYRVGSQLHCRCTSLLFLQNRQSLKCG